MEKMEKMEDKKSKVAPVKLDPDVLLATLRAIYADAVECGKRDQPMYQALAEQIAKIDAGAK
jgi:hypothetical protein